MKLSPFVWRRALAAILILVGCTTAHASDEPSVLSITRWTEHLEVFAELPLLHGGDSAECIVHLTTLPAHTPVRAGQVTLLFVMEETPAGRFSVDGPHTDGVFEIPVTAPGPGEYDLVFEYSGSAGEHRVVMGSIIVFGQDQAGALPHSPHGDITLLKQQQWQLPFATEEAGLGPVFDVVRGTGLVKADPRYSAEISAPVEGIVRSDAQELVLPGARVTRGDILVVLTPPVLGEGWASAQLAYQQVTRDYERSRELRERGVISEREFELIETQYLSMRSGFESVAADGDPDALKLRAPQDGQIVEWDVTAGEHVQTGQHLMTVLDPTHLLLEIQVFKGHAAELDSIQGAELHMAPGQPGLSLNGDQMRLLSRGGEINPRSQSVPLLFAITNDRGQLYVGEHLPVDLFSGKSRAVTRVPATAVLSEDGVDAVYVQVTGESFERRVVTTGRRSGDWVEVRSGLYLHERIVSRGAYLVKLATATTSVGHGHAH